MLNISKLEFCNTIDYIERRQRMVHDIGKLYKEYDISNEFYAEQVHQDTTSFAFILRLLELVTDDKDHWIEWFVYENDFGHKHLRCYDEDGKMFGINTIGQLYDFLWFESEKNVVKMKDFLRPYEEIDGQ